VVKLKQKLVIQMFSFIKNMSWFINKNKRYYFAIFIIGVILAITLLLPANIVADFVRVIEEGSLKGNGLKTYIINDIFLKAIASALLIYIVTTTRRFIQVRLRVRLFYALQVRYMENILAQDATFFESFQSGDLLTRALGDVKSVNFSGGNRLLNMIYEATVIITLVTAMTIINPLLTVYSVLPLSLIFVVNLLLRIKVKKNWKYVREASSQMSNVILESITNVRTIRAFSKEEENYKKNIEYSNKAYKIEKKNLFINVSFQPIFESIIAISVIIAYAYAIHKIPGNEKFKLDDFVKFMLYLNMLASPFRNIGNMLSNFYQSIISLDRLNEIYDAKSTIVDTSDSKVLDHVDSIEFKNVSFKYPNDTTNTLNNVNLIIHKGETLGIVGKTGSGKSTLIRQLMRQFPITSGQLLINGEDVSNYTKKSVREMVGYVPQEHTLFSRSVIQNVELGAAYDYDIQEVYKVIKAADFEKDIENLPDGLDTIVGEYGVTLSGGQKQRLSIARAFMKNADVLIMDDSLSAVDGKTESNIIDNISSLRNGKTNIIVAHRLSAVMNADHIIVLDKGTICEEGTHEELMALNGWYHDLFNHQLMTKEDSENE
jgi:ATP-binding cassette subfamily B protein